MLDDRKWKLATAQFHAIRTNLPGYIHENLVNEYHQALDDMSSASGEDFSSFRIPPSELKPRVTGGQVGFGGPGRTFYSKDNYCNSNLFKRKIDSLFRYLPTLDSSQAHPDSNPAESRQAQAQKAVRAIQATPTPVQHHTVHVENMIGSVIQQGSTGSTATVNFSAADLRNLLGKIRTALPDIPISDEEKSEVELDLATIEPQISARNPKKTVIAECLQGLKSIVGAAAKTAATAELVPLIEHALKSLGC